ncbi:MAG: hypothetical protein SNJ83_13540, partial [Aggregatilineales bacterium]
DLIVYTFVGASGWSGTLTLAGYWLGERWGEITALVRPLTGVFGAGLLLLAALVVVAMLLRQRRRAAATVESPR